jgi:ATP-dependent Clp protease ATP-binding subunit ClpA
MSGEFSEEVRAALASAKERARSLGAESCGLSALVGALLENLDEISFQGLERMGLNPEDMAIPARSQTAAIYTSQIELPLDRMCKRAVELALSNAGGRRLYPSHLLLASIQIMEDHGMRADIGLPGQLTRGRFKSAMDQITATLTQAVERFNWEAVNSLFYARKIAVDLRNLRMGLPHLLGGALMEPSGETLAVFSSMGLDISSLLEKSMEAVAHGAREWRSITKPALSGDALEALSLAGAEACAMEFKQFGNCHIFLGVFRANEASGSLPFLSGLGLDAAGIRWAVLKMANWANKQDSELEKFGPDSIRILSSAARRAREVGSEYVGVNHIIIALLDDPSSLACKTLNSHGADIRTITAALRTPPARKKPGGSDRTEIVAMTGAARKALELAKMEARAMGRENVGSECILLGLLGVEEGAGMLKSGGLDYQTLKNTILKEKRA